VLEGTSLSDKEYVATLRRVAKRFRGKIVQERTYSFQTSAAGSDTGYQQIQTQMPETT
jgi:hypothetical protein